MSKFERISLSEKPIIRRYLVWCYKTTKEEIDKIDRYFTQLKVDERVLSYLQKDKALSNKALKRVYLKKLEDFKTYMTDKERRVLPKKYSHVSKKILNPEYLFLKNRLAALENVISSIFSKKELKIIRKQYEDEMTSRILSEREH